MIAGLPASVAGATVNRFCGSSMQAVHTAAGAIAMGAGDAYVCAGVESMSRVPMGGWNPLYNPDLVERRPRGVHEHGRDGRERGRPLRRGAGEQEAFAVESQRKAAEAGAGGRLADEIVPVAGVQEDGCPRPETTLEALAALEPAFVKDGTVTAGTSSPLTDGAAAVLVTSEDFARAHGLEPIARVRAIAVSGCDPEVMGIGPVQATRKALERAGIGVERARRRRAERGVRVAGARLHPRARHRPRPRATSTAARSRSAIRWARPGRASPARPPPCSAARAGATRLRPSASAAARASPPCSRRSCEHGRAGGGDRRGHDGRRHRRAPGERRPAGGDARPRRRRAARARRAAQALAAAARLGRGRPPDPAGQPRARPGHGRRRRLDRRGDRRGRRREAVAVRPPRRGPQARLDRLVEHLHDPAARAARGGARRARARPRDHPLLQPAALHAPARDRPRRRAARRRSTRSSMSATCAWGRPSFAATTRRASSPTGWASSGSGRRSARRSPAASPSRRPTP